MVKVALRGLAAARTRLVLTTMSIVLGVGFVVGTLVYADTLDRGFDSIFDPATSGFDVAVRGASDLASDTGSGEREPVPPEVLAQVRAVDGVAKAEGGVSGVARIVDKQGGAIVPQGPPTLGLSWGDQDLSEYVLVEGAQPRGPDQMAMDVDTAQAYGFALGDRVTVLSGGPARTFDLVGVADRRSGVGGGATFAFFDLGTAQDVLGAGDTFSRVDVAAGPDTEPEELVQRIGAVLPSGFEAVTAATVTGENQQVLETVVGFLRTALLAFAAVSLLVGGFLILNTFSVIVAQRSRELALLRLLGATRRQVALTVVVESVVVGALASALGVAAGLGLAVGLTKLLAAFGLESFNSGLAVSARTVVVGVVLGVVVTTVAAFVPARRAGRVAPIEAFGAGAGADGDVATTRRHRLVSRFVRRVGAPLAVFGAGGVLARESAARNPRRTVATAAALVVGLALVGFAAVFAASVRQSTVDAVQQGVRAEFAVANGRGASFSTEVAATVRQVPGVDVVTAIRGTEQGPEATRWRFGSDTRTLQGIDAAGADRTLSLEFVAGGFDRLESGGGVALSRSAAAADGVESGDTLPMEFAATGTQQVPVAGVYEDTAAVGDYLLSMADYEANFTRQADTQLLVALAPGADAGEVGTAVSAALAAYPQLQVLDGAGILDAATSQIDQLLALVTALLGLSLLIALLGVANTLALSVFDRTREIGLLRAVGMTRAQVRAAIRAEALLVTMLGAAAGVLIGILLGWVGVQVLGTGANATFAVPAGQLALYLGVTAVAGVLAATFPARRAARLDVLAAIANE